MGQYISTISCDTNPNTAYPCATLFEAMDTLPLNKTVADNFTIAWSKVNSPLYDKILATISGGSDSDVVVDILAKCDRGAKVDYVWCNTGLEYQATQEHLDYLEKKYGITIKRVRPKMPIPLAVKKYGQPFLNKKPVSEYMERLQKHGFKWEDKPFDELMQEYPHCKSALQWWCNMNISDCNNIRRNKLLKEFIIAHPPTFRISAQCCAKSKKSIVHEFMGTGEYQLDVYGVRKAEGGARATTYKSCFNCSSKGEYDEYRPLFWYKNADKDEYCEACDVTHSRCYTEYGLKRTGCAGCPFGKDFEEELKIIEKYEPKLFVAVNNIFKESYEYTRAYRQFVAEHSNPAPAIPVHEEPEETPSLTSVISTKTEKQGFWQMSIFDVFPDLTPPERELN